MSLAQVASLASAGRGMVDDYSRAPVSGIEDQILAQAGPTRLADVLGTLNKASATASGSSGTAEGIYQRQLRGLGGSQSAEATSAANRRLGLSRALTNVDARNRAAGGIRERTDVARSASRDLQTALERQSLSTRNDSAGMEAGREIAFQQDTLKYKQDKAQTLGSIASMAAMFIPFVGPLVAPAIGGAVSKAAM